MAKPKKAATATQEAPQAPQTEQVMPTYDELMAAYNDLRMRSDKNDVITRLQFDFLALEHTDVLPKNYVKAVLRDVMTLLPMQGIDIEAEIASV